MLMQAAPMQPDSCPKTVQAFGDGHWQYQFRSCGGVGCVCYAWANVCGFPRVACPPRASIALLLGDRGKGMRMKTFNPKTWRREVLESHLGLSRGTTSSLRNVHRPRHRHRLA